MQRVVNLLVDGKHCLRWVARWFASMDELNAAGYGGESTVSVPAGCLSQMPSTPPDGALLRAPNESTIWGITSGHRSIVSPAPGQTVTVVPRAPLDAIPN